jgi:hypothetical protein
MGISARKVSTRPVQAGPNDNPSGNPSEDNPHDAIEQEFLGVWISLARLRELVLGSRRRRGEGMAVKSGRRAPGRKLRRKAA